MPFHPDKIRAQFPALQRAAPDGRLPVFLDNPAGTQVPQTVIDAVAEYYLTMNANSGGSFATSQRTDAMAAQTRQAVAYFLNAPSPHEIVIGPNMTTLAFNLSRSLAQMLRPGDDIVLTRMDHDANVSPWLLLARDCGLTVKWVDIQPEDCTLDMHSLEAALSHKTKLVATVHASNAVGTINPVQQIAGMAHAVGAWHIVDAVQSAPHVPLDVQSIGCDFLFCSAYKFYGPHLGIMWGRADLLEQLPAYKVRPAKDAAPQRWETGTPSFETWNALRACIAYWQRIGEAYGSAQLPQYSAARLQLKQALTAIQEAERRLLQELISGLQAIPGVDIAGIVEAERFQQRVPTVAMVKRGIHPDDIAAACAAQHIYVWSGDYYAQEIMQRLRRPEGMLRIGLGHYNTSTEIQRLLNLIESL